MTSLQQNKAGNKMAGVGGHPSRCDCYTAKTPGVEGVFYNADCMEGMAGFASNHFDLAIVDPPYGIGMADVVGCDTIGRRQEKNGSISLIPRQKRTGKRWDVRPNGEYFYQLQRLSKHQIVWGGNYFTDMISKPSSGWIVWNKKNGKTNQADCELAYTNFEKACRKFDYMWNGMIQEVQDKNKVEKRIHPTQKPIALYRWILQNYAEAGWKILDTHVGSGSSLIACEREGFDYVGYEIDKDYYDAACKRIERETAQLALL